MRIVSDGRVMPTIQQYVIKFVSYLRQVGGFVLILRCPPTIKVTATIQFKYCWKWRVIFCGYADSEWWSCNANSAIFQLYPGENKLIFKTNTLSQICIVLGHWSNNPRFMSSNAARVDVYLIQQYVIKFVSYLRQVGGFVLILRCPPTIKVTATIQFKYYGMLKF
jgi:hypothetical protein